MKWGRSPIFFGDRVSDEAVHSSGPSWVQWFRVDEVGLLWHQGGMQGPWLGGSFVPAVWWIQDSSKGFHLQWLLELLCSWLVLFSVFTFRHRTGPYEVCQPEARSQTVYGLQQDGQLVLDCKPLHHFLSWKSPELISEVTDGPSGKTPSSRCKAGCLVPWHQGQCCWRGYRKVAALIIMKSWGWFTEINPYVTRSFKIP